MDLLFEAREKCYRCYRPMSSCMCGYVKTVDTKSKFVILMHPKEFKKIKNGTGHLTHLSLGNSELYISIDFSEHKAVNALIDDPSNSCYLLYPSKKSIPLNDNSIAEEGKRRVVFILDATWDCSKKMLRLSKNLQALPHISFEHNKTSQFEIKEQPAVYCLSTIESTLCVLELLSKNGDETIEGKGLEMFLNPFKAMIAYQQSCIDETGSSYKNSVRFKKRPL
ncbi:MAG: tRNA-uridine aminocarboxypropyltransferase [Campylobacterota bacterium]|nr:tRNA-uridine aminocarboxypropyltransferase [Campylobacterota bacterium]